MENVILTAQNHRNAWSFTDTAEHTLVVLPMTHHFYLELLYTPMCLRSECRIASELVLELLYSNHQQQEPFPFVSGQTSENGIKHNLLKESVYTVLLNNMTNVLTKLAGIKIAIIIL